MSDWRLVRVGDASIVVEFAQEIDPAVNARALAVGEAVRAARHPGVLDVVEGYCSVAVAFDPLRTAIEPLVADLEAAAERAPAAGAAAAEVTLRWKQATKWSLPAAARPWPNCRPSVAPRSRCRSNNSASFVRPCLD